MAKPRFVPISPDYLHAGVFPDGNGVTAWFPPNANAFYRTGIVGYDYSMLDEKNWHVRMEFWQTNAFTGVPPDEDFLTASSGPIGQIIIGKPDGTTKEDHPRPLVNMSQMSFSIPLNRPTCALRAPTTVDLGDWFPAELENGNTPKVEFHITGTCANTTLVQYSLSSTHTTADKKSLLIPFRVVVVSLRQAASAFRFSIILAILIRSQQMA